MNEDNKPKGDKHLLAEKLAKEELNSNAKVYPGLPVDANNKAIASKNLWKPVKGHQAKSLLTNTSSIVNDRNGVKRADSATLAKGKGPIHNVEGRSFRASNYSSKSPLNNGKRVAFMEKTTPLKEKSKGIGSSGSTTKGSSALKTQSTGTSAAKPKTVSSPSATKTTSPSTSNANSTSKGKSR